MWVFCTWQRTHCSLGELALKLSLRRLKLLIISYSTPSAAGNTKVKNKVSFLWKFLYLFATKAVPGSLQREMSRQRNCSACDLVHVCTRMSMCTSVCVCVFFPLLWREPEHTLFPDLLLQHNWAFSFFFTFNRNIWARVCVPAQAWTQHCKFLLCQMPECWWKEGKLKIYTPWHENATSSYRHHLH